MFQYQPRPDLINKNIAIFASIYTSPDKHQQTLEVLEGVVDTVIDETTCQRLKVIQSDSNPDHFMLYEQWSDFEEFFSVQLKRSYRKGFMEKLGPLRSKPSTFEFFEILFDQKEKISKKSEKHASAITQLWLKKSMDQELENALNDVFNKSEDSDIKQSLKLFKALDDPLHYVIYDEYMNSEDYSIPSIFGEILKKGSIVKQQHEVFQTRYRPVK